VGKFRNPTCALPGAAPEAEGGPDGDAEPVEGARATLEFAKNSALLDLGYASLREIGKAKNCLRIVLPPADDNELGLWERARNRTTPRAGSRRWAREEDADDRASGTTNL
jgi:hypothetical protein